MHFYFPTVALMFHECGNYKTANRADRKSWRFNAKYSDYREQHYIIYIRLAKRLDLNYFSHWKEMTIMLLDGDANYTTMAITSLHVNVSNQHVTHLQFIQCYISNIISTKKNLKCLLIITVHYFEELSLSL